MRTKVLREFKQGLVSYKEEYKTILNYKQWKFNILNRGGIITARMGKGNYSYGLFTLEDGIGRVDVGCCWLLLIDDGCYWLLDDCWLRLGCWWLLLVASDCWMMLVTAGMLLVGGKVFEYFRDVDDLRLRQFCRQKKIFEYFRRGNEEIWLRQALKLL